MRHCFEVDIYTGCLVEYC